MLEDGTFNFVQFHFHSTSEHVINGERAPLEMHFVNQALNGSIAVLAVFIKEGEDNPEFDTIVASVEAPGEQIIEVDLDSLLPRSLRSFRYLGSTTTPPCVAGVQ